MEHENQLRGKAKFGTGMTVCGMAQWRISKHPPEADLPPRNPT